MASLGLDLARLAPTQVGYPGPMQRNSWLIWILRVGFAPLRRLSRIEVKGLDHLPRAPCLLVANHSIGAVYEIFGLLEAWERYFVPRGGRPVFGLAHRVSFRIPVLSSLMSRIGAVPATFEAAKLTLNSGADLIVFPGGNWEATQSFTLGNAVDFHGHRGWIRVAKESQVEIVPVAITGSYRTNPVFGRSRLLAKLSLFDFFFGVRWMPITLGQFIWSSFFYFFFRSYLPMEVAMAGTFATFCFTPLFAIWPAKIQIQIRDPISSSAPDDMIESQVLNALKGVKA
jgi:1-acyl-sn-glycerol-3-phosphate acyltransferase